MPVEIEKGAYCIAPELKPISDLRFEELLTGRAREVDGAATALTRKNKVFYSPLHDLESVFWMSSEHTFNHPVVNDDRAPQLVDEQRKFANGLFHNLMKRQDIMQSPSIFQLHIETLHPSLFQCGITEFKVLRDLVEYFQRAGRDRRYNYKQLIPEVHDKMQKRFQDLLDSEFQDKDIIVQRWERAKKTRKV